MKKLFMKINFLAVLFLLLTVGCAYSITISYDDPLKTNITGANGAWYSNPTEYVGEIFIDMFHDGSIDYVSFCLERNVGLNGTDFYNVDSVQDGAVGGGIGGGNPDYLSEETKWIYYEYTYGGKFGVSSSFDVDLLATYTQEIIWKLESETDSTVNKGFLTTDAMDFYENEVIPTQADEWYKNAYAGYNIQVLNPILKSGANGTDRLDRQSLIIINPVPEPATMLLFGTGLIGLAGLAHRRRNKK